MLSLHSMYMTAPTDEFRTAAEAVRINAQEMTPVGGEKGVWRLPTESLENKPEIYSLVNLYNKTRVCEAAGMWINHSNQLHSMTISRKGQQTVDCALILMAL